MSPEETKKLLEKLFEDAFVRQDLDAFYAHYAPDVVFQRAPFPPIVGKEENRKADEAMFTAFTDNWYEIRDILVEGERAIVHWLWKATHSGISPSLGIPATGKRIEMAGVSLYYFQDDKVVRQWEYSDMLGLAQQLGLVPA